ncbi:cytochrome P450 [Nocardiopsis sp. YSL2]|uniref:cytochrome P450 n=1 Tax=Nocardiopsis sp. YSL2 TaxID=2939492 RepID=UPI0026F42797|nr:cytochrome P450 [Nocardiopsis sp. YSL2]
MSSRTVLVSGHADVRAVLDDPRFTVPPVHDAAPASPSSPPAQSERGLAWLRSRAVRFSNGDEHLRRRAAALDLLAGLAPPGLRAEAAERARALLPVRPGPAERPEAVSDAVVFAPVAVPPVHDAAPASPPPSRPRPGLAWLRSTAVRFSNGDRHLRRRSVVLDLLAGLAPLELRADAAERARALLSARPGSTERPEAVSDAVVFAPVAVLGTRLGIAAHDLPTAVDAVRTIADVYLGGADNDRLPPADAAVRLLSGLLGTDSDEERTAQRIVLLVQSCAATAALLRSALALVEANRPSWTRTPPVADLVAETLRFDPPARRIRRVASVDATVTGESIPAGTEVLLDLAAANRDPAVFTDPDRFLPGRTDAHHLAFGHGIRPCPGSDHATALACGVLDTALTA